MTRTHVGRRVGQVRGLARFSAALLLGALMGLGSASFSAGFCGPGVAHAGDLPPRPDAATPAPGGPLSSPPPPGQPSSTPQPGTAQPAAPKPTTAPSAATSPVTAPETAAKGRKLGIKVKRVTLANGLRVVLNEDHSSPTVAVAVTYDVGSRNEEKGRSGFAHLFEHMMFQGSRNVDKGEHFKLITERGGTLNGTTSADRTNYFEIVPANGLSTVLWLEADRMKTLAISQQNFENQRKVVQEEYRMRVSNAAYAAGMMRLHELVFQGYWPHEHDPIGSMVDLDNAKLEWLRAFHASYYAPNNAVLALAGDFDSAEAVALIQRYFGDANPVNVPVFAPGPLPEQTAERREQVQDANAKTPGIIYGWPIPPTRTDEHYALELAGVILGYGDSSVLERKLVREEGLIRDVGVWTNDHRGPDVFTLQALLTERADQAQVEKRIGEELARLGSAGPTQAELDKALQRLQSYFLFSLEGNLSRATQLSSYELFWGDANLLNEELDRFFKVSKEQIRDAVAKYLTPNKRSVVTVLPLAQPSAAPSAPAAANAPSAPPSTASKPASAGSTAKAPAKTP